MGRIARVLAHGKNVVVDPVVTGSKFVGRKTKQGALSVKESVSNGVEAIRVEERKIEEHKAVKAEAREVLQETIEDAVHEAAARRKAQKSVKATKRTTAKKPARARASA